MGARSTQNRYRDRNFIGKDIEITIKKAKRYFAGDIEFFIFKVLDSYYAQETTLFNDNPIKHFVNKGTGGRSKWVERKINQ